jgi:hypothetical protein
MKRFKGPELKMPELKVPPFLADLYYDLRDRRLLPLIALVLVAIAAVPFLLGGEVERPSVPTAGVGATAALEAGGAKSSSLTVVEATPGLRDYRKRLRGRAPADPFKQLYTEPAGGSASGSSAGGSSSSGSSSSSSGTFSEESVTTESSTTTVEAEPGGGSNGSSTGGGNPHLVLFDYAIDVRISRSDAPGDGNAQQRQEEEPAVKHRVLPQTPLPGDKAPVVTYFGPGRKDGNKATGKVLLLVSGSVQSISGEYRCISGGIDNCQMLEVEPGFPLTFAYGDNGVHYTIKVLKIELVVTGHT